MSGGQSPYLAYSFSLTTPPISELFRRKKAASGTPERVKKSKGVENVSEKKQKDILKKSHSSDKGNERDKEKETDIRKRGENKEKEKEEKEKERLKDKEKEKEKEKKKKEKDKEKNKIRGKETRKQKEIVRERRSSKEMKVKDEIGDKKKEKEIDSEKGMKKGRAILEEKDEEKVSKKKSEFEGREAKDEQIATETARSKESPRGKESGEEPFHYQKDSGGEFPLTKKKSLEKDTPKKIDQPVKNKSETKSGKIKKSEAVRSPLNQHKDEKVKGKGAAETPKRKKPKRDRAKKKDEADGVANDRESTRGNREAFESDVMAEGKVFDDSCLNAQGAEELRKDADGSKISDLIADGDSVREKKKDSHRHRHHHHHDHHSHHQHHLYDHREKKMIGRSLSTVEKSMSSAPSHVYHSERYTSFLLRLLSFLMPQWCASCSVSPKRTLLFLPSLTLFP